MTAWALFVAFCPAFVTGIEPQSLANTTFRADVETVALNVTVTGGRRGYVGRLTKADFVVYDNGTPQETAIFGGTELPLDLAVMLDLSGSVRKRVPTIRKAAQGLLQTLRPGDRGAVIGFNDTVRILADWSDSQTTLRAAVDAVNTRGGTALFESLYVTLRWLNTTAAGWTDVRRQALVVVSDGDDTSSLFSYTDLLDTVRRSGTIVYTVRIDRPVTPLLQRVLRDRQDAGGEYVMSNLARETGARPFTVRRPEELSSVFREISEELRNQYLLGFVPATGGGSQAAVFRTIAIDLPGRPDARARTRTGYVPFSSNRAVARNSVPSSR